MDVTLPEIASSTGPKTEVADRAQRQTIQAQAEVMDLAVPLPIDETSIDYGDQIKEHTEEQKIEEAKKARKQNLSEKKAATLVKARAAKKEKARLAKLNANDAGDIINRLVPLLDKHFEKVNRRLDDLQVGIAHEGALQNQQLVTPAPRQAIESIAHPETIIELRNDAPEIPVAEPYSIRARVKRRRPYGDVGESMEDYEEEERQRQLYNRRTRQQFQPTGFENDIMERRAQRNPEQGSRPAVITSNPRNGEYVLF